MCLLLATIAVVACDDTTQPEPPPDPPQIKVNYRLTLSAAFPQDTTTGLQSNDAFDIIVDSQDRTWVATQAGISRFRGTAGDGTWNQNNVLPNPKCRALLEHNGKLWVGTWGGGIGVYDMNADSWFTLDVDSGLVNDMVGDISAVGDSIYIATNDGASIYVDDDQLDMSARWDTIPVGRSNGILTPIVSVVVIAHTSTRGTEVWYGPRMQTLIQPGDENNHGITVFREGQFQPIYYTTVNSDLAAADVNDIFFDASTDLFWLAFPNSGIASLDVDAATWTYHTMADGLPSDITYSVTAVGDVIWAATQAGVARLKSDGTWQGYGRSGGLPADRVRRVYSNEPSELWTCFIDRGAALLDPNSAQ
jgi:ligand-binding sensor domain-containing protein